jgi:predicted GNAT family acetyltransferase
MPAQPLDRPVWASLSTRQAALSEGSALARRYARDVNLFAAAGDDSAPALDALAGLVGPGEQIYLAELDDIPVPDALSVVQTARAVQMVAAGALPQDCDGEDVLTLTEADAPEMVALTALTRPGPFRPRTLAMGTYRGIRIGGQLVAMAGERMRLPGHVEVSGVCTHPDFRGRGLARRVSAVVAAGIAARGDTPFLHAWASNTAAISLYASMGFRLRTELNVAVLTRG